MYVRQVSSSIISILVTLEQQVFISQLTNTTTKNPYLNHVYNDINLHSNIPKAKMAGAIFFVKY